MREQKPVHEMVQEGCSSSRGEGGGRSTKGGARKAGLECGRLKSGHQKRENLKITHLRRYQEEAEPEKETAGERENMDQPTAKSLPHAP